MMTFSLEINFVNIRFQALNFSTMEAFSADVDVQTPMIRDTYQKLDTYPIRHWLLSTQLVLISSTVFAARRYCLARNILISSSFKNRAWISRILFNLTAVVSIVGPPGDVGKIRYSVCSSIRYLIICVMRLH